jgi:hypothetical protein
VTEQYSRTRLPVYTDLPIEFYKPQKFELAPHPLGYETVSVFAIESGKGLLVGIGMVHLDTEDPHTGIGVSPQRQGLLYAMFHRTFDFHRRTFAARPARAILEALPWMAPDELCAMPLPWVIENSYGEIGMIAREAAIRSRRGTQQIDVMQAERSLAEQYKITCDAMASKGFDAEDVWCWFGLREYAWCRSVANTRGVPIEDVAVGQFSAFSTKMGLQVPWSFTALMLDTLCRRKGVGNLADFRPEQLDRFLRGVNPPVYAPIQEFVVGLRDRLSGKTITDSVLDGGVSLAVYGVDHVTQQYEHALAGARSAGCTVEEIDWSPKSNWPRFLERSWFEPGAPKAPAVDLDPSPASLEKLNVLRTISTYTLGLPPREL